MEPIDSILNILENLAIVDDYDIDLENLINKFTNLYDNSNMEWEKLSENYSKLKYISQLIDFYQIPNKLKFEEVLKIFFIEIDKINQY